MNIDLEDDLRVARALLDMLGHTRTQEVAQAAIRGAATQILSQHGMQATYCPELNQPLGAYRITVKRDGK